MSRKISPLPVPESPPRPPLGPLHGLGPLCLHQQSDERSRDRESMQMTLRSWLAVVSLPNSARCPDPTPALPSLPLELPGIAAEGGQPLGRHRRWDSGCQGTVPLGSRASKSSKAWPSYSRCRAETCSKGRGLSQGLDEHGVTHLELPKLLCSFCWG